jgi:hypothetical protein
VGAQDTLQRVRGYENTDNLISRSGTKAQRLATSSRLVFLAPCCDAVVNWEKRLARQMPLLEEPARGEGGRILVPVCGSGWHVVTLAGREVTKLLESLWDRLQTIATWLEPRGSPHLSERRGAPAYCLVL